MSEFPTPPSTAGPSLPATSAPGTAFTYAGFLPRLPHLYGLENVDKWNYSMRLYLNHHDAYTIIRSQIDEVFPMLLTAGLKAFEDDYTFDPQELWNYITHCIRMPKREDTLKDRMLLFLFHVDTMYDEEYDKNDYLNLRQRLRDEFGVCVHPHVMLRVNVEENELFDDDMDNGTDFRNGGMKGRWITCDIHLNFNVSSRSNHEEFMKDYDWE